MELARQSNPGVGGLLSNQGPFTRDALMGYFTAAGGVGLGLVVADFLDRFVATRAPSDAGNLASNHPWYGRNAAAAQQRRPDAMRLGAQAGGAIVSMALAYFTRNMRIVPWLFGGTAVGFGANMLNMLVRWWLMPAIFKVDAENEESFANRMYPLEQSTTQDTVAELFENWDRVGALAAQQQTTPMIFGPLGAGYPVTDPTQRADIYTLGDGQPQYAQPQYQQHLAAAPQREFFRTGRLGACGGCGGDGGCYGDCPSYNHGEGGCAPCRGKDAKKCMFLVEEGDSLETILAGSNADIAAINAMNGGGNPETYWIVGNTVKLPWIVCKYLEENPDNPPQGLVIPGPNVLPISSPTSPYVPLPNGGMVAPNGMVPMNGMISPNGVVMGAPVSAEPVVPGISGVPGQSPAAVSAPRPPPAALEEPVGSGELFGDAQ